MSRAAATPRRRSFGAIFVMPALIGLLSLIGLVSALAGDGFSDVLSWAGLAAPLIAIVWARARRRQ